MKHHTNATLPSSRYLVSIMLTIAVLIPALVNSAAAQDSTRTATRVPSFWTLEGWPQELRSLPPRTSRHMSRLGVAVAALCGFYQIPFDDKSPIATSPSPMAWPRVFANDSVNPLRLKVSFERLAAGNGLEYREMIVFDPKEAGDSIASALMGGDPVLLNAPDWPIVYGYDRREADPWWWIQHGRLSEILFDSERRDTYSYWSDNPASNLAWAITGPDTTFSAVEVDREKNSYAWLKTVNASVAGDPANGIAPYPLSIRAFRGLLENEDAVPALAEPVDDSDPLGVRRVREARLYAVELLQWLTQMSVDTTQTNALRLTLYYYHNSLQAIDQLDSLFYGGAITAVSPMTYRDVWEREALRSEAVQTLNDLLEWEKQAAEQIALIVALREPPKKKK